ncbi:MAG: DNA methyltransferase [Prevotella sp.]|nr:SAM-dependent DNA methyltransferase [Prevotella sp.]MDY6437539.1 DNA methyltransferase [Prevotella sp.]
MNVTDDKQERQVVSRQRVAEHGEVYTAKREVCAMLDLVKEEAERIDSRFLEPACGTGNFLVEIMSRKMEAVRRQFVRNRFEYDQASAMAVSSMYGVELLPDNVDACRNRLLTQYLETYRQHQHQEASPELERCISFLLRKNILCGDALTMLRDNGEPVTFCEWTFIGTGGKVKRRDFELSELLRNVEYDKPKAGEEGLLFADTGEPTFVHLPKREFPIVNYLKLPDYE